MTPNERSVACPKLSGGLEWNPSAIIFSSERDLLSCSRGEV